MSIGRIKYCREDQNQNQTKPNKTQLEENQNIAKQELILSDC